MVDFRSDRDVMRWLLIVRPDRSLLPCGCRSVLTDRTGIAGMVLFGVRFDRSIREEYRSAPENNQNQRSEL